MKALYVVFPTIPSPPRSQLNARLDPFRKSSATGVWKEIVNNAYMQRVDLSAHGFYITPDITGGGGNRPFNYYVYGASVSEVELDVLTGDFQVGQEINVRHELESPIPSKLI